MADYNPKEVYERFAGSTYATMYENVQRGYAETPSGRSMLVVIGERHGAEFFGSPDLEKRSEFMKPGTASAFTHISAIESAIRLAGKENVVFSVELPEDMIQPLTRIFVNDTQNYDGHLGPIYSSLPLASAMIYADRMGLKIVGNDPEAHNTSRQGFQDNEKREQATISGLLALATQDGTHGPKKIIIHIGGAAHLSNLMGYTDQDMRETQGYVAPHGERNPFVNAYPSLLYVATGRLSELHIQKIMEELEGGRLNFENRRSLETTLAEHTFFTNPQNAIQIDPPGQLPYEVARNIEDMVIQASAQYHQPTAVLEPAGERQAEPPKKGPQMGR